jgi:hypothetical protein
VAIERDACVRERLDGLDIEAQMVDIDHRLEQAHVADVVLHVFLDHLSFRCFFVTCWAT